MNKTSKEKSLAILENYGITYNNQYYNDYYNNETKYKKEIIKFLIKEEKEKYEIENVHDKLYKYLLSSPKEAKRLIQWYLKVEIEGNLEKYNSSYITSQYKNKEADIVYKLEKREIYFLIEHQSTVDRTMPYRMLAYSMEILRDVTNKKDMKKKDYKFPLVVPIVLYTGKEKWDVKENIEEIQEKLKEYKQKANTYKLIDVNRYTKEEIIEDDTIVLKVAMIERSKNEETVKENINKIYERILKETEEIKEEHIEKLIEVMKIIYRKTIDKKVIEEIENKIEKGGKDMEEIAEMIRKEVEEKMEKKRVIGIKEGKVIGIEEGKVIGIKEGKIIGIEEGIKRIVKRMIKENIDINTICEITNLSKEEVERMK